MKMKRKLLFVGWAGVCALLGRGETLSSAVSPNGRNEIRFAAGTIQVFRDGRAVTGACRVGLDVDGAVARPELHAANEGVAYRWVTDAGADGEALVRGECADVTLLSPDAVVWAQQNPAAWRGDPFQNTWQNLARRSLVKDLTTAVTNLYFAPFVVEGDGWAMGVTETDLRDYPGWNFRRSETDAATLAGIFAGYPAETASAEKTGVGTDERHLRYCRVLSREPYLVKTQAKRTYPWRVFMLADSPVGLIGNGLVQKLAAPSALGDASWVKPGKVAWDWWNAFDNQGPAGCTTETYLRFVDFAAKGGLEYVILDEGWSEKLNIWKLNDRIDLKRILAEAASRDVGIILWLAWDQARGLEEEVAAHFAAMGVKGFKVDFIDRDDAEAVRFCETFAAACARHRLLVDFHGSFKPAGLDVTYPNVVNYEGVYGLEQLKWKGLDMIENDAALPYVRGLAGMMDYTPGAMDNYVRGAYRPNRTNPGSLGTRVHQLALMTMLSGRLQMLCDSPSKYERERECFTFLAKTPVAWDETRGLLGTIGKNCVMARRAGTVWTVAAIADWEGASFVVPLDFLGKGEYKAEVFADASDADVEPMRYRHDWFKVRRDETLPIRLAPGGGWVARFVKNGRTEKLEVDLSSAPVVQKALCAVDGKEPSLLPSGKDWKLVWHDEFDGPVIDRTKWMCRESFWGQDFPAFAHDFEGVEMTGETVKLQLVRKGDDFTSPHLQTGSLTYDLPRDRPNGFWPFGKKKKPLFMKKYGYFEIRCRLPKNPGWHAAFWLQAPGVGSSPDPETCGVETDIMENYEQCTDGYIVGGNGWGGYGSDSHWWGHFRWRLEPTDGDWHRFGVDWSERGYVFYCDGKVVGTQTEPVSRVEQFLLVSTEPGGYRKVAPDGGLTEGRSERVWGKPDPRLFDAVLPDCFEVDYVRVFDSKENP